MADLKPLSEQIEQRVRVAVQERVNAALAQAREAAANIYTEAFTALCGPSFGTIVHDALRDAEVEIAEAAQKQGEKTELDAVLLRLVTEGEPA